MRRIAIVVFDGLQTLDATGPLEVFHAAARIDPGAGYEIELVATSTAPITTPSGLQLAPHRSFAGCREPLDTLIVAGGEGSRAAARDDATVRFVTRAAGRPPGPAPPRPRAPPLPAPRPPPGPARPPP